MLTALWSVKGGVGVSVTAAVMAVAAAKSGSALLFDAGGGDQPSILGVPEPSSGFANWVESPADVALDSLRRLEVEVASGLQLLVAGRDGQAEPALPASRVRLGICLLADAQRSTIVDLGQIDRSACGFTEAVLGRADRSLLVTTPCYLALRRAQNSLHRPSGIVLIDDPDRALGRRDVQEALDAPVVCTLSRTAAIARSVDAGLLLARVPMATQRAVSRIL
ncbi:MAG: hypothetical protein V3V01_01320 [Acidimicrobiales bacterium]